MPKFTWAGMTQFIINSWLVESYVNLSREDENTTFVNQTDYLLWVFDTTTVGKPNASPAKSSWQDGYDKLTSRTAYTDCCNYTHIDIRDSPALHNCDRDHDESSPLRKNVKIPKSK